MQLCVHQLLLVAMVHDASASMGMMARRLLPKIEQGAKRRLQFGNMGGSDKYSAECLAACPAVQDMQTQIDTKVMSSMMKYDAAIQGGDLDLYNMTLSALAGLMAETSLVSYGVMCESKPAMVCLAEHADVCSTEDTEQQMFVESFDCMCSTCPCLQTAMADLTAMVTNMFASLGDAMSGEEPSGNNTQVMEALCKMAPALACAEREPVCPHVMLGGGGVSGDSRTDPAAMVQQCAALGHTIDVNTCTGPGEEDKKDTSGAFAPGLMLILFAGLVRVLPVV